MVQGMTLLLSLDQDSEQFAREVSGQLSGSGLQVVRSFDLQSARGAQLAYACPHHGTDGCNCQLIMLLAYGQDQSLVTLVIYGCDQQTWVSIVNRPEQRVEARQEMSVLRALSPGNFAFAGQGETLGIA